MTEINYRKALKDFSSKRLTKTAQVLYAIANSDGDPIYELPIDHPRRAALALAYDLDSEFYNRERAARTGKVLLSDDERFVSVENAAETARDVFSAEDRADWSNATTDEEN